MSDLDYKSLLIKKYKDLEYPEPDYDDDGFPGLGTSQKEIDEVVKIIKKIDPSWKTIKEVEEGRKVGEYDEMVNSTKIPLMEAFPEFYDNLQRFQAYESAFLTQQKDNSLSNMSNKQVRWLLLLLKKGGADYTAKKLANYFNKERNE